MGDLGIKQRFLQDANRRLVETETRIARQKALIAQMELDGTDASAALRLLTVMRETRAMILASLDLIIAVSD